MLAFYNFVRAADDVADNPTATPEEKLRLLEAMRASLEGESDSVPEGVRLRQVLKERGLSPVHALLVACIHRVAHHRGTERLIWLLDIHLLASRLEEREWTALVSRKDPNEYLRRLKFHRSIRFASEYGLEHTS